jgi:hypothetical protein
VSHCLRPPPPQLEQSLVPRKHKLYSKMAPELQPTTRPRGATSSSSDSASLEKNDEVLTTSQTRDVGAIGDQEHAISSVENEKDVLEVAAAGHAATDSYGHALVHFDPVAEAKLRVMTE